MRQFKTNKKIIFGQLYCFSRCVCRISRYWLNVASTTEAIGSFWEGITGGVEFDESGIVSDKFEFTITNSGQIAMAHYEVVLAAYSALNPTESSYEKTITIEELLNPGESKDFTNNKKPLGSVQRRE